VSDSKYIAPAAVTPEAVAVPTTIGTDDVAPAALKDPDPEKVIAAVKAFACPSSAIVSAALEMVFALTEVVGPVKEMYDRVIAFPPVSV
jgi:hypothetical protein